MILLTALFIERWRVYRSIWQLGIGILALAGALLTKEASIFALPALFIMAIPSVNLTPLSSKRLHILITIGLGLLVLVLIIFLD